MSWARIATRRSADHYAEAGVPFAANSPFSSIPQSTPSTSSPVKANLAGIADEEYVQMTRTKLDEMIYMGTKVCTALDSYVNELWLRT